MSCMPMPSPVYFFFVQSESVGVAFFHTANMCSTYYNCRIVVYVPNNIVMEAVHLILNYDIFLCGFLPAVT